MEKETDLRVARTRQLIREAFLELMGDIGFEKITVHNLVQKAGVNRSTFYLHYTDKFDLLNKLEEEILNGLKDILLSIDFDAIFNFETAGEPYPHIVRILGFVKANERFYKLILGPRGDPSFIGKTGAFIRVIITDIVVRYGIGDKLRLPLNYMISMFIAIITSFLSEWVRTGMTESPFELACIMTPVIRSIAHGFVDLSAGG